MGTRARMTTSLNPKTTLSVIRAAAQRARTQVTASKTARLSLSDYELPAQTPALATIDGWPINLADADDAVTAVLSAARRGESFSLVTLNLDHLVKLRFDPAFRRAYAAARFVTADGEPVARLAARQDARIERTTGADLVVPLARRAARENLSVYLFGTTPDVVARAASDLVERCEGKLAIAGSASPLAGFDPEGAEADAALDRIAASGARLCFVCLGAPKQEIFAARAAQRGIACGFVCVGAALDFIAGAQIRAPAFMQRNGLEWLWRLATSPRRLAKRYLMCALVLADIALVSRFRPLPAGPRLAD